MVSEEGSRSREIICSSERDLGRNRMKADTIVLVYKEIKKEVNHTTDLSIPQSMPML